VNRVLIGTVSFSKKLISTVYRFVFDSSKTKLDLLSLAAKNIAVRQTTIDFNKQPNIK
jgi:hypothetical protein